MAAVVEAHAPEIAFSLSSVYSYWKEFDLDGRRSKLDEVGRRILHSSCAAAAGGCTAVVQKARERHCIKCCFG